jgi:DNA invertase Pin-like site-specific DNA recombinase
VFRETASGAQTNRAQLRKTLDQLEAGDVFMVTRLDRLARSTRDLSNILAAITDRKAGFRSLGDTWADTTTPHERLMLAVLGGLAEFERDLIRARTTEGRKRAVARGVKLGRPHKLAPHQRKEAQRRLDAGETCHSPAWPECPFRVDAGLAAHGLIANETRAVARSATRQNLRAQALRPLEFNRRVRAVAERLVL